MKKAVWILFVLIACLSQKTMAGDRTTTQMIAIAKSYLSNVTAQTSTRSASSFQLLASSASLSLQSVNESNNYFYIYGYPTGGFVLISGDDEFSPVLGYSTSGKFPSDSLPSNLKYWLSQCVGQMKAYKENGLTAKLMSDPTFTTKTSSTFISPMISTVWNQDRPFNDRCPLDGTTRSASGCVATAMAQIMKYYNYPTTGTGSNSYKSSTLKVTCSANFGNTTYLWSNMVNNYNDLTTTTAAQDSAVATLTYHCGVSVNMDYTKDSSSAYDIDAATALINYFNYDSHINYYLRDYYTDSEWIALAKSELSAGRPLLYGGSNADNEGHEFVVDGYDTDGLVHVNWGWGGPADGYYNISVLEPIYNNKSVCKGFSVSQSMVTGIQEPSSTSTSPSNWIIEDSLTVSTTPTNTTPTKSGTTYYLSCLNGIFNCSPSTFTGKIGFLLYANSTFTELYTFAASNIASLSGYTISSSKLDCSNVANGTYKLLMGSKGSSESTWQVMRSPISYRNYYTLTISNGVITSLIAPSGSYAATGITTVSSETPKIYTSNGSIHVYAQTEGEVIEVYNLSGQIILRQIATDGWNNVTPSVSGILIVKINDKSTKIEL